MKLKEITEVNNISWMKNETWYCVEDYSGKKVYFPSRSAAELSKLCIEKNAEIAEMKICIGCNEKKWCPSTACKYCNYKGYEDYEYPYFECLKSLNEGGNILSTLKILAKENHLESL